ncbi:unnamed protein product [Urochloa humidicola]
MSSAPIRQGQQQRGSQQMHRVMAVAGSNAQWNGGVQNFQLAGGLAGDNEDPLMDEYPGSDAPSAACLSRRSTLCPCLVSSSDSSIFMAT